LYLHTQQATVMSTTTITDISVTSVTTTESATTPPAPTTVMPSHKSEKRQAEYEATFGLEDEMLLHG
jgi:hypothetical protein